MDPRTIICGVLAGLALVCGAVLFALGDSVAGSAILGFAGTALGYVVGLNSEPVDA